MNTHNLALDGSGIDGSSYIDVTDFARDTPWLNEPMYLYTSIGIAFFGVLIIAAWWKARREDSATMAAVVAAPIAAVAAYLVNDAVKGVVEEPRPCNSYPTAFILEKCPPLADYSFPSNHTVVAAAVAAALFFVSWRWGTVAAVAAALMAFSRVYVGAHYPHDVIAGLVVGFVVGLVTALVLRKYVTALVEKLSTGPLRPLLSGATAPEQPEHNAITITMQGRRRAVGPTKQ
ncbi:phosphatase PAP2 family protein (plasmid) [Rhodococcus erythropolis]|uniref:Phosphatase PAP2 family protein n=1 Tax=Rhodococcus qingshengii JCM 15477 TaxID=1303681 RepID=A0AB38RPF3_RHOSG|nr:MULTISPECIES: phosphatase PAP2 family protein [Rhodococcus]MBY6388695.1 phosphatase PAP2 family protein [Rhodococcus erythropolis]MBY6388977.1 phosphatase PAP2 family protein [Rhodococcus erythropolis]MBY6389110.1 phosphatase PAP2 family protein [Rhodococcus erythropolis]MBY6389436.1 phosphatase PAP2 family protein [Rhodococcus erythropolis]MBY6389590.1 phosphatase PAP2 family protein [Rhodococcus erythropolis]